MFIQTMLKIITTKKLNELKEIIFSLKREIQDVLQRNNLLVNDSRVLKEEIEKLKKELEKEKNNNIIEAKKKANTQVAAKKKWLNAYPGE